MQGALFHMEFHHSLGSGGLLWGVLIDVSVAVVDGDSSVNASYAELCIVFKSVRFKIHRVIHALMTEMRMGRTRTIKTDPTSGCPWRNAFRIRPRRCRQARDE
jgi:hypothetical protein